MGFYPSGNFIRTSFIQNFIIFTSFESVEKKNRCKNSEIKNVELKYESEEHGFPNLMQHYCNSN